MVQPCLSPTTHPLPPSPATQSDSSHLSCPSRAAVRGLRPLAPPNGPSTAHLPTRPHPRAHYPIACIHKNRCCVDCLTRVGERSLLKCDLFIGSSCPQPSNRSLSLFNLFLLRRVRGRCKHIFFCKFTVRDFDKAGLSRPVPPSCRQHAECMPRARCLSSSGLWDGDSGCVRTMGTAQRTNTSALHAQPRPLNVLRPRG